MVSVAVAAALVAIALVDGVLAGFRAATGRNGRIRKRRYYLAAMRRGLLAGTTVVTGMALAVGTALMTATDPGARLHRLVHAGAAMLWALGPYAILVVASLIGYGTLPRAAATLLILLGLGPFTLIRPWVAIGAGGYAAWVAGDAAVTACAALAVAAVLAVEPYLHRRWYAAPV